MANEMEVWTNEKPLAAFGGAGADMDLGAGVTSSYPVIGYRGKVWSLRYNGESTMFLRPDDGTPAAFIDVVILRAAETKSKSYYESWQDGDNSGKRPVCASIDSVRPDKDVQEKQAEVCALCPRNQWYTNAEGRKKQDCADYKRLAVALVEVIPGTGIGENNPPQWRPLVFNGEPLLEAAFLRVPGGSLRDLKSFGEEKGAQGFSPISFITRLSFVPEESYPKFVWTGKAPIRDPKLADFVLKMRDDPVTKRITGEELAGQCGMRTVEAEASAPSHPTERAGTVAVQNQRVAQPADTVAPVQGGGQVLELSSQLDGSYGDPTLGGSSPPASRAANDNTVNTVGQSAVDVTPGTTDPALEALLAGMMELDS